MEDMTMLWNAILTLAVGAHLAINYATKAEVNSEIGKILSRFDKLEAKLDRWMEKH